MDIHENTAIILIDFINEIVDASGKLAGKGYADFEKKHGILENVSELLSYTRENNILTIHVRIGFSHDYIEQPQNSPLFGNAKKYQALQIGEWGTEFHPKVAPVEDEVIITKHRVSAFYETSLDLILRTHNVRNIILAGCATDMAVQSTFRDGHDRDYHCAILADCCIAATDEDHTQTIRILGKLGKIRNLEDFKQSS